MNSDLKHGLLCRLFALGLAGLGSGAFADPAEFVRGRVIEPATGERVLRLAVPQDVYEWVTRSDLGDVRVFNAAGTEVPYRVRRPQSQEEFTPWVELPVFALPAAEAGQGQAASVNIQLDDGGAVVAVSGAAPGLVSPGTYLIDASEHDAPFSQMRVAWKSSADGFVGKFRLQASEDLNTWHSRVGSTTLADLSAATGDVVLDTIEVKPTRSRYLKLTQLEGNAPLAVESITVRNRRTQLPERQWKTLIGESVDDGFEFVTGGRFPLDRVTLEMDQDNYLVAAQLFSRARPKDPWRKRGTHSFYATEVDGVAVTSKPVPSRSREQYWRVELASESAGVPKLRVGWRPDEVIFLNQGPPPLVFAYGRGGLEGKPWPMRELLSSVNGDADLAEVPSTTLSAPTTLGGPAMQQPAPAPVDWQTVLLWSVLLLGVAVVAAFAYRLVKASG